MNEQFSWSKKGLLCNSERKSKKRKKKENAFKNWEQRKGRGCELKERKKRTHLKIGSKGREEAAN